MPPTVVSSRPIIGMEIHVELAAQSKMFASAQSPARDLSQSANNIAADDPELSTQPNTLVDPVVLALPGSLPVMNKAALEMAMLFGLAAGCSITRFSVWDRKHYTYPDLPKGYQISQLAHPIVGEGVLNVPVLDSAGFPDLSKPSTPIRIARAHLEEDAGKLMHEAPGGQKLDFSIVDYNRAGTALLEIVTLPDITSSEQAVSLARTLRGMCIALGITRGVMQQGHMRFEPNINCELTMSDGSTVRTPIVEVKNLNSFRSLRGAIEFELADQPQRYLQTGISHAPGLKTTRGWDDGANRTFVQREKEEAHDYRYMPDPDLPPVVVSDAWLHDLRLKLPAMPLQLYAKFQSLYGLAPKEAFALIDEPADAQRVEAIAAAARVLGVAEAKAGKLASTLVLQWERSRTGANLHAHHHPRSLSPQVLGAVAALRDAGKLTAQAGDALLDQQLNDSQHERRNAQAHEVLAFLEAQARGMGLLLVRDEAAMKAWIDAAIAAHPQATSDVRSGKVAAIGRLVGEVVKQSQGKADPAWAREKLLAALTAS
jgi:aspartyl-tRNA(Asn)/glutamyl-tRNA(Gln) amidotransferase subunit B